MGDSLRNYGAGASRGTTRTTTTTTTATTGSTSGNAGATSTPAAQGGADGQFHHIGQGQWTATQPSSAAASPASFAGANSRLPSPQKLYERFPGLRGIDPADILRSATDPEAFPCTAMQDYAPEEVLRTMKELSNEGESAGNVEAFLAKFPSVKSFLRAYPELREVSPFESDDAADFEQALEAAIGEKECGRLTARFTPAAILHGFRELRTREFKEEAQIDVRRSGFGTPESIDDRTGFATINTTTSSSFEAGRTNGTPASEGRSGSPRANDKSPDQPDLRESMPSEELSEANPLLREVKWSTRSPRDPAVQNHSPAESRYARILEASPGAIGHEDPLDSESTPPLPPSFEPFAVELRQNTVRQFREYAFGGRARRYERNVKFQNTEEVMQEHYRIMYLMTGVRHENFLPSAQDYPIGGSSDTDSDDYDSSDSDYRIGYGRKLSLGYGVLLGYGLGLWL